MAKKKPVSRSAKKSSASAKKTDVRSKKVVRVTALRPARKPVAAKKTLTAKAAAPAPEPDPVEIADDSLLRRKGVRKATLTTGIRNGKPSKSLGRSRIPTDAPLDVVFQNDSQAREAFQFLGVHTIRELERFHPDDLVMRLTSPAKQTVGRIRKILAMNNRCLEGDESFALEYQEQHMNPTGTPSGS